MPDDRVVYDIDERNKVTVTEGARIWRVTAALRFARRENLATGYVRHVLQQLYVATNGETDWRDVPLVRADV